jgi:hypothetical protein
MKQQQIDRWLRRAWSAASAAGLALVGCAVPWQWQWGAALTLNQFEAAPEVLYESFDEAMPTGWVPDSPANWKVADGRLTAHVRGDSATAVLNNKQDWRE